MKGIILAGGKGTRLYPVTLATCKQLLPVFDKPMIYYPLSVLMMAGIREILIISTPEDLPRFRHLFGDGSKLGLSISYKEQAKPNGIAEAFIIGASFIKNDNVALILGDNIFYGHDLAALLVQASKVKKGAVVFGYEVKDPERYGVIEFDSRLRVTKIVEKPKIPKSSYAVTGLYFYDNSVIEVARHLKPSARKELEITDINSYYLQKGALQLKLLDRGFAWLDTGTHDALQKASAYVQTIQERQGIKIACIEEIAYQMGFIDEKQLLKLAKELQANEYGAYLAQVARHKSAV